MYKLTLKPDSAGALANTNLPVCQAGPPWEQTCQLSNFAYKTHIVSHALCTKGNWVQ